MIRISKNVFSILLALILTVLPVASAAAEGDGISIAGDNITIGDLALRPDGAAGRLYENDGMKLLIPLEFEAFLLVETPQDSGKDLLFSVSEKASLEAAKASGYTGDGAGWLFGIGRIDEKQLHQMLCYDMSGAEVFAKDGSGQYYVFYHPTDVRYVRENNEAMVRDQQQWATLTQWAWADVRGNFLAENPQLTEETYGNSELEMYLARIAYLPDVNYTVSTTEFGPLAPDPETFDAMPFIEQLLRGVTYERDDGEAPDGEYVVLSFPDDGMRFDFFLMEGKENYIRQVWSEYEMLYKAVFEDDTAKASEIMQTWYAALADAKK